MLAALFTMDGSVICSRYNATTVAATGASPAKRVRFGGKLQWLLRHRPYARVMHSAKAARNHRPREWRRRVILPALVRSDGGWGNASILNISSRGFLIRASRPIPKGSKVEVRHAGLIIQARVVWRDGARAGLAAENCVPVEDILSLDQGPALQLTAPERTGTDRRVAARRHDDSRIRGRLLEFAAIAVLSACAGAFAFTAVHDMLARPLASVQKALGE